MLFFANIQCVLLVANSDFATSDYSYFSLNYVPRQTAADTVRKHIVFYVYRQTARISQYSCPDVLKLESNVGPNMNIYREDWGANIHGVFSDWRVSAFLVHDIDRCLAKMYE